MSVVNEIKEIVYRKANGWNNQDLDPLISVFHPNIVWSWPETSKSHNTLELIFELGKFDNERCRNN